MGYQCGKHLRIPCVRTVLVSENCPSPTAFMAAKRTEYNVYGLREEIERGSVTNTDRESHVISRRAHFNYSSDT